MIKLAIAAGLTLSIFCGLMTLRSNGIFNFQGGSVGKPSLPFVSDIKQILGLPSIGSGNNALNLKSSFLSPSSGGGYPSSYSEGSGGGSYLPPKTLLNQDTENGTTETSFRIFILSSSSTTTPPSTTSPSLSTSTSSSTPSTSSHSTNSSSATFSVSNLPETSTVSLFESINLNPGKINASGEGSGENEPNLNLNLNITTITSSTTEKVKEPSPTLNPPTTPTPNKDIKIQVNGTESTRESPSNQMYLPPNRLYLPPRE